LIESLASLADRIWIYGISIEKRSDQSWKNVSNILKNHFPNSRKKIEEVIFTKDHPYWLNLREKLYNIQESNNLNLSIHL
jgi:hypothetical protein